MSDKVDRPRAVVVASSHVVRGSLGNRAAVFALETLGFTVWALPTVTLPWHEGRRAATRIVPSPSDWEKLVDDLIQAPWLGEVGAVLTGFLGDAEQAVHLARLVQAVKGKNRHAVYLCDPVLGDDGEIYVEESIAAAIRDHLVPLADIATPNRTELEWLAGAPVPDIEHTIAAALDLGPRMVLTTSAPVAHEGSTGNLLLTPTEVLLAEHRQISSAPHGTGDLTAALFLARLSEGMAPAKALQATTASVFDLVVRTASREADELTIAIDRQSLVEPMGMVQLKRLKHPGGG